ncbi:hypothetical protein [Allonocardiopsis opalescens]|uniref:Uncharacterized protein n=1 Tax=Allonocardiopsis opalescens TaxID=1144618 RepID=A0A2T0PZT8_9ACTN|nr:hypothetical protein [Allonocardiopsis opalescens]PRX97060.1 hypothetical protein CLV72_10696 [Allonocardiopsis opalescens]
MPPDALPAAPQDPPGAGPAEWVDLRRVFRTGWILGVRNITGIIAVSGVLTAFLVLHPAGAVAGVREDGFGESNATLLVLVLLFSGMFLLAGLSVAGLIIVWAPRTLARQGVAAGRGGLTLLEEARWWTRRRVLHLPWEQVRAVESRAADRRRPGVPAGSYMLVVHLEREPPRVKLPAWAVRAAPHEEGPDGVPRGGHSRVVVTTPGGEHGRLLGAIGAVRPDLLTDAARDRAAPAPAAHAAPPPDPAPPPGPPPSWGAESPWAADGMLGRLELRRAGIARWVAYCVVAVSVTASFGYVGFVLLAAFGDGTTPAGGPAVLWGLGAAALAALLVPVAYVPRLWARQAIELTERGIDLVRRPLWWSRGHTAHIPWTDVRAIVPSGRSDGLDDHIELFLRQAPQEPRLPGWAVFVPAGEPRRDRAVSLPRVVLGLRAPVEQRRLERMLRGARPDLFDPPAPDGGSVPAGLAQWVDLGRRRLGAWTVALLVPLAYIVAVTALLALEPDPAVWAGPVAMVLLCAAVVARLVQVAPRLFTRQGVSVHAAGVTLVQEPSLWFPGRVAHLRWDEIAAVRERTAVTLDSLFDRARGSDLVVDVFLRTPGRAGPVPTWARVHPHEAEVPPATPAAPLTRIRIAPGHHRQPALVQALRAARPELLQGG